VRPGGRDRGRRGRPLARALAGLASAGLVPLALACAPAAPPVAVAGHGGAAGAASATPTGLGGAGDGAGAARGLLIDVQAASIAMLREVELRLDDGSTLRFAVEGDVGITPGHAREHMVNAEPVTVTYRAGPNGPVALRIED
jgi:hypothetical protein